VQELLSYGLAYGSLGAYFLAAALLGVSVPVVVLAIGGRSSGSFPRHAAPVALTAIGIASMIYGAASPRVLNGQVTVESISVTGLQAWASRIGTAAVFIVSGALLIQTFANRVRPLQRTLPLAISYLAFVAATVVVAGLAGTVPGLKLNSLYAPFAITAFLLATYPSGPAPIVHYFRLVLAVLVYGSALSAIVAPKWALYDDFEEFIPGVGRLYGLTAHANALGMVAAALLCLELFWPAPRPWRWANRMAGFAVLILAQSKTAWGYAALILIWKVITDSRTDEARGSRTRVALLAGISVACLAVLGVWVAFEDDIVAYVSWRLPGIASLTGRDKIWEITLEQWRENPLFGYGPNLWDFDFRERYNMLYVGQAHNQFVQTLGEAGIVGITGLIAYLALLVSYAWKAARSTRQLSVVLTLGLLIRSVSETPFDTGLIDSNFLIYLATIMLICACAGNAGGEPADERRLRAAAAVGKHGAHTC
jgi:exopolysaccharide production protein ExoQ